jgi:hypothetical protein
MVFDQAPSVRGEPNRSHFCKRGQTPTRKHWIERVTPEQRFSGMAGVSYRIIMYRTCVMELFEDGRIYVTAGGYQSYPTTRDFIRHVMPRFSDFVLAGNSGLVAYTGDAIMLERARETYAPGAADYSWLDHYDTAFGYAQHNRRAKPTPRVEFLFTPDVDVLFDCSHDQMKAGLVV